MKQQIAGKTIDVLVKEELRAELRDVAQQIVSGYLRPPAPQRLRDGGELDASGDGTIVLSTVTVGMELVLNRLLIEADGYTPASPYTNAAAYFYLLRGDLPIDFLSLVSGATGAGSLPALATWTNSYAPRYRDGEKISVQIVSGPANGIVTVTADGFLSPLSPGEELF